jgi:DNA invertase Pin-like site-specific DNA recombinase
MTDESWLVATPLKRCAIYARKSIEQGLDHHFNSLDAQCALCSAYITSQKHRGWVPIDKPYIDAGQSGGTIDRPALQELMADIEASRVAELRYGRQPRPADHERTTDFCAV